MIVRQFLHWVRTAPAGERAEATGALARAFLYSDLSPEDRAAVAAAIAEVGAAEACLIAIENPYADIAPSSIDRIIERFGHLGAIREALLERADLPLAARQALVRLLSSKLADFVADRAWLARERADEVVREACEKATVTIAALGADDTRPLIRHLRVSGQLNAGLVLRALLSGNMAMFEDALAELSELPLARVQALVHGRGNAGFRAVFDKAGLPATTYVAFREALAAIREAHHNGEFLGMSRLKRRMVERVLTSCERCDFGDIEPLLILLRRFAAEAAREDARIYCDELVAQESEYDPPERDRAAA